MKRQETTGWRDEKKRRGVSSSVWSGVPGRPNAAASAKPQRRQRRSSAGNCSLLSFHGFPPLSLLPPPVFVPQVWFLLLAEICYVGTCGASWAGEDLCWRGVCGGGASSSFSVSRESIVPGGTTQHLAKLQIDKGRPGGRHQQKLRPRPALCGLQQLWGTARRPPRRDAHRLLLMRQECPPSHSHRRHKGAFLRQESS